MCDAMSQSLLKQSNFIKHSLARSIFSDVSSVTALSMNANDWTIKNAKFARNGIAMTT